MAQFGKNNLQDNAVFLHIGDLAAEKDFSAILEQVADFHPADKALTLDLLEDENALILFNLMKPEMQAEVLLELNEPKREFIVENLKKRNLSKLVDVMESDDAADVIGLLDAKDRREVLEGVEKEGAREVRELLKYGEDTAGGLMSKEVVAIDSKSTVENAIAEIRKAVEETEQVFNVFVVEGDARRLKGILPLNRLVLAKPKTMVADLMEDVASVTTDRDQEEVAMLGKKYDMVEIPVVDLEGKLVGRITHDDILDVITEEADEDLAHMAGSGGEIVHGGTVLEVSRKRLTWLLVGLAGGVTSAVVMSRFENSISKVLVVAFFVPVVMAMGGIAGIQSSTITVRGLGTGEIGTGQLRKRLRREMAIGGFNGMACGALLACLIAFWQGSVGMGLVVGGSLLFVMLLSTLSGTVIPLALKRLGVDPALATGPFVTTLNDIVALAVYFSLVTAFLE